MKPTFVLGRIAGVRVGVHWSILVIFTLIALGLAEGRFPDAYPGRSWWVYWLVGLLTAALFFASLLAHELAHAVVARRNKVAVDDIVLWLLGGVARLRSEASTPAAELRIAGVGPLVSLALGVGFALAGWLVGTAAGPGLASEALMWLAVINLLLALFNSVPAAPLDGGRLLRAFLWWRTGDRARATAGAAAAGRGFGWFLLLFGLLLFARGDVVGGLWLVMIAWFLIAAATAEGQQAQLRAVLAGVPVRHAMTPSPVTVPAGLIIAALLADPRYRYRHSAFPVIGDDGRSPAGLLTLSAAGRVAERQREVTRVREVMIPRSDVTVVGPDDQLAEVLPQMLAGGGRRALVVDESGSLVGIVASSDISRTVSWLMTAPAKGRPHSGGGPRDVP
ncbi:site-2 protease family protein [Streptomyces antarcticus]|uniref:site-2 protease family protein n=1 Tax=Streptomyces antarcticus TaxID=2996458 RepID=UPI002270E480|nr:MULTISPECIES: site-2 protease family protein [unclassified Streptomyces]MCY0944534.1 site-2 protease family protein [Streptomyces sp. H34-AA3]MCZ4084563.1 site-2 protease family protein [Streptomyces sp. H34-S5]